MNEEAVIHEVNLLKEHITRLSKWNDKDGNPTITFGELFADDTVQNTFETLLGTLKAAKKRGVVKYVPQILLQGSHDAEVITLLTNTPKESEEPKKPPPPAIFGMPMPPKKKEIPKDDEEEDDAPIVHVKRATKGPQRSSRISMTLTEDDLKEVEKTVNSTVAEAKDEEEQMAKAKPLPKVALPGLGQGFPILKKTAAPVEPKKEEPKQQEEVVLKKTETKPAPKPEEKTEPPKPVEKKLEPVKEAPKPVEKKIEPVKEAPKPVEKKVEPVKEAPKPVEKKEERPTYLPKPAPPISAPGTANKEDLIKKQAEKAAREKEIQDERKKIAAAEGEGSSGSRSIAKLKGAFESGTGVYTYAQLKTTTSKLTKDDIDLSKRESYMSEEEFLKVMGVSKGDFAKMPAWKQNDLKKKFLLY